MSDDNKSVIFNKLKKYTPKEIIESEKKEEDRSFSFSDIVESELRKNEVILNTFNVNDLGSLKEWISIADKVVNTNNRELLQQINSNHIDDLFSERVRDKNNKIKSQFEQLKNNNLVLENNLLKDVINSIDEIDVFDKQIGKIAQSDTNKFTSSSRRESFIANKEKRRSLLIEKKSENQPMISKILNSMKEILNKKFSNDPDDPDYYDLLDVSIRINKASNNISQLEITHLIIFLKEREDKLSNWELKSYISELEFFLSNWSNLDDFKNGRVRIDEEEWNRISLQIENNEPIEEDFNNMNNDTKVKSNVKVIADLKNELKEEKVITSNLRVENENLQAKLSSSDKLKKQSQDAFTKLQKSSKEAIDKISESVRKEYIDLLDVLHLSLNDKEEIKQAFENHSIEEGFKELVELLEIEKEGNQSSNDDVLKLRNDNDKLKKEIINLGISHEEDIATREENNGFYWIELETKKVEVLDLMKEIKRLETITGDSTFSQKFEEKELEKVKNESNEVDQNSNNGNLNGSNNSSPIASRKNSVDLDNLKIKIDSVNNSSLDQQTSIVLANE